MIATRRPEFDSCWSEFIGLVLKKSIAGEVEIRWFLSRGSVPFS
jgi:hypothetical protein